MSDIYETLAQIQRIQGIIPDLGSSIKAASASFKGIENYSAILRATSYDSKMLSEALDNFQSIAQRYNLQGTDLPSGMLKAISGIGEQLRYVKEINLEAVSSVYKQLDMTKLLKNYGSLGVSSSIDYAKFTQAFQNTLDNILNLQAVEDDYPNNDNAGSQITIDTIVDETQNEYEKICDSEKIVTSKKINMI